MHKTNICLEYPFNGHVWGHNPVISAHRGKPEKDCKFKCCLEHSARLSQNQELGMYFCSRVQA